MSDIKTHGILLKKTIMANDDGVLDFFTSDLGRITCFIPKFARSKKKAAELDFFRLLDLEIFKGRNSYRLRNVHANAIFHGFEQHYSSITSGFLWLEVLHKILPEAMVLPSFFSEIVLIMGHVDNAVPMRELGGDCAKNVDYLSSFFWAKLFDFMGIISRFDSVRSDIIFNVSDGRFYLADQNPILSKYEVFITNESRQVLEFLRRSSFDIFWEKRQNLPTSSLEEVDRLFVQMKEYHLGE